MNILKNILLLAVALHSIDSFGQDSYDFICWNLETKIAWSDFKGEPQYESNAKAGCAAKLSAQGYRYKGLPHFNITNCFDRNSSWTLDTSSVELLKHEQLHFDIAELYARKMRKAVDSLRQLEIKDFDPYSSIVQYFINQRNVMDSIYDEETAHSVYKSKQELWDEKIRNELKSLEEYSSPYSPSESPEKDSENE